jgi:hypothetical protein
MRLDTAVHQSADSTPSNTSDYFGRGEQNNQLRVRSKKDERESWIQRLALLPNKDFELLVTLSVVVGRRYPKEYAY